MLRHGFHPPEAQQGGSIQIVHSVHPEGRTPADCAVAQKAGNIAGATTVIPQISSISAVSLSTA
jgi:hypothetical protein